MFFGQIFNIIYITKEFVAQLYNFKNALPKRNSLLASYWMAICCHQIAQLT